MDHSRLLVKADGHSLELLQELGRIGGAFYCVTCDTYKCDKINKFNEHYVVKKDPSSPKGWHVVEARE